MTCDDERQKMGTGWVVESSMSEPAQPLYLSRIRVDGVPIWSPEHARAMRFARKQDAEQIEFAYAVRIAEHAWG